MTNSALNLHRSGSPEPAQHVWAESVLLGTSEGRGWDGLVAEAGQCRSFEADSVSFAGHYIGMNTARVPFVFEKKTARGPVMVTLAPGQLSIIPAEATLRQRNVGASEWGGVEVSLAKVERVVGRPIDVHEVHGVADERLVALLRLAVDEVMRDEPAAPLYADALCIGIISRLAHLFGVPASAPRRLDQRRLRAVLEGVEDDIARRHTIEDLARAAGLSAAHFARSFKQTTGETPHAFVMRRRLERARAQLATGASIAEASLACGFADQAHLSRLFKQRFGLTPRVFVRGVARR